MLKLVMLSIGSTDADCPAQRALLPAALLSRADARTGKGRAQSFAGYLLLALALQEQLAAPVFSPQGKPFFADPAAPHFSLSHAGLYVVCALSDAPIGVDLEAQKPRSPALARRVLHPAEQTLLNGAPPDAFTDLWTRKEALLKCTGEGLSRPLASFSVRDAVCTIGGERFYLQTLPFPVPGYSLSVCTAQPAPPPTLIDLRHRIPD